MTDRIARTPMSGGSTVYNWMRCVGAAIFGCFGMRRVTYQPNSQPVERTSTLTVPLSQSDSSRAASASRLQRAEPARKPLTAREKALACLREAKEELDYENGSAKLCTSEQPLSDVIAGAETIRALIDNAASALTTHRPALQVESSSAVINQLKEYLDRINDYINGKIDTFYTEPKNPGVHPVSPDMSASLI